MIETLPMHLFVLREIGCGLFVLGLGGYMLLRAMTRRPKGVTGFQHFVHRVLFAVGIVCWMVADGLHGSWGMVGFDLVVLLLLGWTDIRLVWVKLVSGKAPAPQS